MITLKDWLESVNYKITDGGPYEWCCYGNHSYFLDSWDSVDGTSFASITFDTETKDVFEVQICNYNEEKAFRWLNNQFKDKFLEESKNKKIDPSVAWDNIKFVELKNEKEYFKKFEEIMHSKV